LKPGENWCIYLLQKSMAKYQQTFFTCYSYLYFLSHLQSICLRCKWAEHEGHRTEDLSKAAARCIEPLQASQHRLEGTLRHLTKKLEKSREDLEAANQKGALIRNQVNIGCLSNILKNKQTIYHNYTEIHVPPLLFCAIHCRIYEEASASR
jgi:hypothetical protein